MQKYIASVSLWPLVGPVLPQQLRFDHGSYQTLLEQAQHELENEDLRLYLYV